MTRVRVPGAARYCSPRVNFQCRLSYDVRTAPVCNRIYASTSAGIVKSSKLLFEQTKILPTPVGTGGVALAAAVPYRVERPELPASDNEVL